MRNAAAALVLALLAATPVSAQTTATERSAAGPVLERIEALQGDIGPTELAQRLVQRHRAEKDAVMDRVARLWWDELGALSDHIGENPESGFQEYETVDTLTQVLAGRGFTVETGVAGLETAFEATWTSPAGGDGPALGIIVEYDALRGTTEDYHGCQHNAQSPVGFAAAFALSEYMEEHGRPGSIRIYGTPAEEMGPPAKVIMHRAGIFDDAEILVRSHGSGETSRNRAGFGVCCLNINMARYTFTGIPAHQRQSWAGRNALSAAVQFYTAVDHLRPTFRPEAVIQGVIPEGGRAPNVVPDRAVVDYYIRYPDEVYLAHMDSMIANAARAAALATGTEVEIEVYGEYRDGITLGTLEELGFAYAQELGAPAINSEPQRPAGYEETGFVTRDIPGLSVSVFSSSAPGHSYDRWLDSMKEVGHTGFLLDAKIMAAVLFDYLEDPDFRAQVQREHREMAGLFDQYLEGLRQAYSQETGVY
ncbi:MAG: peptidase dimerization domain-containing protein [Gemmatimonadales bacterium]|nr:MAG: peptidase dimerization domain-containing protein [Gemmatimonadales bacterium]